MSGNINDPTLPKLKDIWPDVPVVDRIPGSYPVVTHDRCQDLIKRAITLIKQLGTATCYCDMGIGDPRIRDHSVVCKEVKAFLQEVE